MNSSAHVGQTVAVALSVVWTMVYAGTYKRRLSLRDRRRRCPSCGVLITGRTCKRH